MRAVRTHDYRIDEYGNVVGGKSRSGLAYYRVFSLALRRGVKTTKTKSRGFIGNSFALADQGADNPAPYKAEDAAESPGTVWTQYRASRVGKGRVRTGILTLGEPLL
jgi:hypothetical protein